MNPIEGNRSPAPPSWWKKGVLIALSTLLGLLVAEAALRLVEWRQGIGREDVGELLQRSKAADLPEISGGSGLFGLLEPSPFPRVVYQVKPNLRGIFNRARIATNSHGMRGPEVGVPKPPGTFRIVGLGDSHMFGWGVEQDEYYLARLERELNRHAEPGWRFEVLNFAAPGYNTAMEVAVFEHRALPFDPDFVLLHFVGNDIVTPHFLEPPPGLEPSRWRLVELVRGLLRPRREENVIEGADEFDEEDEDPGPSAEGTPRRYSELGGRRPFRLAIQRLAELARQRGVPVLMFELGEDSALRRWARDRGIEAGFRFLNPLPAFDALRRENGIPAEKRAFKRFFVGSGTHPNANGHEAYACALFCELEEIGIPHLGPAPERCPIEVLAEPRAEPWDAPRAGAEPQAVANSG